MKLRLERKAARVDLIPLIDCIFLLLVFFIYSMLSMAVYRGIPVMLPTAETVEGAKEEAVLFITVDERGDIYVDRDPVRKAGLLSRLKEEHAGFPDKIAIISAHGESSYRIFVDVLDSVRLAGFRKVSIEARPKKAEQQ